MITALKEDIQSQTRSLVTFAQKNLRRIHQAIGNDNSEIYDFYYGLIRRHTVLNRDIENIISDDNHNSFISLYIISRCILDDYIRIKYITSQLNSDETIICLNADARKKNFDNLFSMAKVNEEFIHKQPPYYPTIQLVEDIKKNFLDEHYSDKYFTDKANFKFKQFPTTRNIVDNYPSNEKASMYRSFYLWRHFSDYIHFSSFSAHLEINESSDCHNFLQEAIYHS